MAKDLLIITCWIFLMMFKGFYICSYQIC